MRNLVVDCTTGFGPQTLHEWSSLDNILLFSILGASAGDERLAGMRKACRGQLRGGLARQPQRAW